MTRPLLAFDIDGTLVGHGQDLSREMVDVIQELHGKGWPMIISTARRRKSAFYRLKEMSVCFKDGIFNTGASTWVGHRCARAHVLNRLSVKSAIEILSEWNELDFFSLALKDEGLAFSRYLDDQELVEWGVDRVDVSSIAEAVENAPIRICGWKAGADLYPLASILKKKIPSMNWQVTDAGSCLFGTSAGVGKGKALSDYAENKGFSPENVIAFGDDFSDVDMFNWAGRSVAMASAPKEVKAQASETLKGGMELTDWLRKELLSS